MFVNYIEARNWLENFIPQTYTKSELGLSRIRYLLKLLNNPQNKFKSIHIGGTSGKGSTAFYLARALRFAQDKGHKRKLKIGLHTSPHLTYIGERMQINGKAISSRELVKLVNFLKAKVESMEKTKVGLPSYFEILVALSFLYFAKEKVDWAVVEVGLGGRLDATNVLNSKLSVITNIGLDHTDILGKTIEKIAKEKAGIIKPQKAVVTAVSGKALEVIKKIAKEQKSPLHTLNTLRAEDQVYFDRLIELKVQIDIVNGLGHFVTDECFFLVNIALKTLGFELDRTKQLKLFSAKFMARFEQIDDVVLIDGAHNKDKAKVLINWVKKVQRLTTKDKRLKPVILVCAFKKGKDWKGILRLLLAKLDIDRIYTTHFVTPTDTGFFGSIQPEEIKKFLISNFQFPISKVKTFENSQEAVWEAVENKAPGTRHQALVLVTGSLYLAGEARTIWF